MELQHWPRFLQRRSSGTSDVPYITPSSSNVLSIWPWVDQTMNLNLVTLQTISHEQSSYYEDKSSFPYKHFFLSHSCSPGETLQITHCQVPLFIFFSSLSSLRREILQITHCQALLQTLSVSILADNSLSSLVVNISLILFSLRWETLQITHCQVPSFSTIFLSFSNHDYSILANLSCRFFTLQSFHQDLLSISFLLDFNISFSNSPQSYFIPAYSIHILSQFSGVSESR